MDPNEISVCERMIMKVLWDSEEDLDLMTVTARVKEEFGKDWKLQTVATFMTRLQKKKYIDIYRIGRYSHYHPLVKKDEFKMSTVSENIKYFDKGNVGAFVCGLFDNVKLTNEDKEMIRKKIDELE
ncbi:MAG: BlaI/MecI/CopY family transcriptional regulator [Lachnospiraceae bacterium]|nr:BlaI/MecI/CopY family transcriptional regulator [Lachnospiraceae bacterium]